MDKETLKQILSEKSMSFTEKEIREMVESELEKSPEEMDTDFIDACLDALSVKYNNINSEADIPAEKDDQKDKDKDKGKINKVIKFGKILAIAVVFSILLGSTISTGAKYISINASEDFVTYCLNHFNVDLSKKDDIKDIAETFSDDGIESVVLPSAIIGDDYRNYKYQNDDTGSSFKFEDNNSNIYGDVIINTYNDELDFISGKFDVNEEYYAVKELTVNDLSILVLQSNDLITIVYLVDNNDYTVTLHNCDFETAIEIAETIGEIK